VRIAFLNPWRNAAENQAFSSLEIAASRIGHKLLHCTNSDELESAAPDFVLAAASTQPKLTGYPTYGVIHEPRDRFLANKEYFHNLLSYDGYLTISDKLAEFLTNLLFGVGRPSNIGFYYNSCQVNVTAPDFLLWLRKWKVKLTYCGTNWDKRRTKFFMLLSELDNVEIFGPAKSWQDINRKSYKGTLGFDGMSVQEKYRQNGVGLVLLSDKHLADDVISNRIFEITSVGAIAICCRTPWLERNFGDSVYYFDQQCSDRQLIEQIRTVLDEIRCHPEDAFNRSRRAQQIFEEKFCAERLLQNAIKYHLETHHLRAAACAPGENPNMPTSPLISVIVRCGGRPSEVLRRALNSIANQTFGRFEVILVRYRDLDMSDIISQFSKSFESIACVDCLGGTRSKSLWCGLHNVKGDYFAVLDDDDELMPNHFEWLFLPGDRHQTDRYFAYTGSVRVHLKPKVTAEGNLEKRVIFNFGISECQSFFEQSCFFSSNCFVASSSLLDQAVLADPKLTTAEDSYLILSLLAKSKARFNFRATAVHYESEGGSSFQTDPNRANDVLNLYLRLLSHYSEKPQVVDAHDVLRRQNETIVFPKIYDVEEQEDTIVYHAKNFALSRTDKRHLEPIPFSLDMKKLGISENSFLTDPKRLSMYIDAPRVPWGYAVQFGLIFVPTPEVSYLVEIDCSIMEGTIGFGVLNKKEDDFLYRVAVPASTKRILVHLPVEDMAVIGRFVIQNWDAGNEGCAKVNGVALFSE